MKKLKSVLWVALVVVGVLGPERVSAQTVTFDPNTDLPPIVVVPPKPLPKPRFSYSVCPPRSVTHWDKIVFSLGRHLKDIDYTPANDPDHAAVIEFAKRLKIRPHAPLDIKVLDNPREVADLQEKVAVFLLRRLGTAVNRQEVEKLVKIIHIYDVDYAIVCSALPHFQPLPVQ